MTGGEPSVGHLLTAHARSGRRPREDLLHENAGGAYLRAPFGPEVTPRSSSTVADAEIPPLDHYRRSSSPS